MSEQLTRTLKTVTATFLMKQFCCLTHRMKNVSLYVALHTIFIPRQTYNVAQLPRYHFVLIFKSHNYGTLF